MATATKNESTTATWLVTCDDHDCGSPKVEFIRKSEKDANRSAGLFRQCGYRKVTVRQFTR